MAGEKYAQRAVARLAEYLEANLPAQLRIVETAQGLASGALVDPIDYVQGDLTPDGRTPIVEIFCESGSPINYQNHLDSYDCTVALTFSGDAKVEDGQKQSTRYMTALIDCVRADHTLGSTVNVAIDTDRSFHVTDRTDTITRHTVALGVDVHVQE
jgi:hypothetical protein